MTDAQKAEIEYPFHGAAKWIPRLILYSVAGFAVYAALRDPKAAPLLGLFAPLVGFEILLPLYFRKRYQTFEKGTVIEARLVKKVWRKSGNFKIEFEYEGQTRSYWGKVSWNVFHARNPGDTLQIKYYPRGYYSWIAIVES